MSEHEANDLTCVDVEFISLVKHAASRLPFRVTKNDQEGGLIMDFFSLFKKEDELAAAVEKDAGTAGEVHDQAIAAARKLLETDGYAISKAAAGQGAKGAAEAEDEAEKERLAEIAALKARLAELEESGAAAGEDETGVDDDDEIADAKPDSKRTVKKLDELGEGQAALARSLGEIGTLIEGIEARVAATESGLRKAEGKLRGTIPGTPVGDPEEIRVAKSSAGEAPPLMDTGMHFND